MDNQKNRHLTLSYSLYIDDESGRHLVEKTTQNEPFEFISGFGIALDAFEQQVVALEPGAQFQFTIPKDQAYGDYHDEQVLQLERDMFNVDGHFDHERVHTDAVIPLQDEEGTRFWGRVTAVDKDKVTVDLNHPLAGEDLHFEGSVIANREATDDEIRQLMKQLTGGCGCGGSCGCGGDCEGGCGSGCNNCKP